MFGKTNLYVISHPSMVIDLHEMVMGIRQLIVGKCLGMIKVPSLGIGM